MNENTDTAFIRTPADALMAVAALAISIDGTVDDTEVARLQALAYMNPLYEDFAHDELEAYVRNLTDKMRGLPYGDTINKCNAVLPPQLKETAYAWAVEMAAANGMLAVAEDRLLHDLRAIFGITAEFSRIIDRAVMALLRDDSTED